MWQSCSSLLEGSQEALWTAQPQLGTSFNKIQSRRQKKDYIQRGRALTLESKLSPAGRGRCLGVGLVLESLFFHP